MAKRKLLQWMRDRLMSHAKEVVQPNIEKRALDAAYKKAAPMVAAIVTKKFPPAEMKSLKKWHCCCVCDDPRLQLPNGSIVEFQFDADEAPSRPDQYQYRNQIFLADASTSAAVEKWIAARDAYKVEREKRLVAYRALVDGAGYVEDVIDVWPEAKDILPAGSVPIPLGPDQIALVRRDQKERKAA